MDMFAMWLYKYILFVQYMYIVNLSTILQIQIIFLGVCILASLKFMPIFALILL